MALSFELCSMCAHDLLTMGHAYGCPAAEPSAAEREGELEYEANADGFLEAYRRAAPTQKLCVREGSPAREEQVEGGLGDDLGRGVKLGAEGAQVVPGLVGNGEGDVHAESPGLLDDIKPSDKQGVA